VVHFVDRYKPQYGRDEDGEYLTLVKNLEPWEPKNEDSEDLECILPYTKSIKRVFGDWGVGTEGTYGFNLPGHGEAYDKCGTFMFKGCLDTEKHNQVKLDCGDVSGKAYIKKGTNSCLRASCPVCYEKWAGKEASRIEKRLEGVTGVGFAKHIVVSPPLSEWLLVEKDYPKLRSKSYKIAFNVGFKGGSAIFHPFRRKCAYCGSLIDHIEKTCLKCGSILVSWVFSPHFHMIGYGFIENTSGEYDVSGWIVKNLGRRDSVSATAFYQLSHAGIHEKYHTVTWFGICAYNKLKVELEDPKDLCPVCGRPLKPVKWVGVLNPLEGESEGGYWVDPSGWVYVVPYAMRGGYGYG
jgi:ATPase involved in DNA repair